MPTYDYQCEQCGHTFETFQSMRDEPLVDCPSCTTPNLRRLITGGTGVIFRGSGFYVNDSRSTARGGSGAAGTADKTDKTDKTGKTEGATGEGSASGATDSTGGSSGSTTTTDGGDSGKSESKASGTAGKPNGSVPTDRRSA